MASSTTTFTGALYGTGEYGIARYGRVFTNVSISVDGVSATASAGTVTVSGDITTSVLVTGVSCKGFVGNVSITTTQFNYVAVREQYGRARTVYVRRRTTANDRTVYVAA